MSAILSLIRRQVRILHREYPGLFEGEHAARIEGFFNERRVPVESAPAKSQKMPKTEKVKPVMSPAEERAWARFWSNKSLRALSPTAATKGFHHHLV